MYVKKNMSGDMSSVPPVSPRRCLYNLDYSKIGEKLDKLENSNKLSKSEREQNRLKWIQLIVKLNKNRSMQPLYKYLDDKSFIQSVDLLKQQIYFQKLKRELIRKKWLKLKTGVIDKHRANRFDSKSVKVRGIRMKQTSLYLTSANAGFIEPDFSGLLKLSISPSIEPIHSLRGDGPFEDDVKARNVKNVKRPSFFKKEALKLYLIFILIGLLIGYVLYRRYHQKLYSFLKLKDSEIEQMSLLPKDNESSFTNIQGPSQNSIIQNVTNKSENATSID